MTVEEIKAMRGGDVLALVRDMLLDRAQLFRGYVGNRSGVDWSGHDSMCAAAEVLERIRATGKDQVERKVKVDRLVELTVDVARSMLISEILKREPKEKEPEEVAS